MVIGVMVAAVAIPAALSIPALRGNGPADERPGVPLERLLLPRPATGLPGDPSWSLYGTWQMEGEPRSNLARRWTGGNTQPALTQTVQEYATSQESARAYTSGNPIAISAESAGVAPQQGDVPGGLASDTANVGCIGGRPPECNIWIYWARYGQYNVSLSYTSTDAVVAYDTFATHVRDTDRIIAGELGR